MEGPSAERENWSPAEDNRGLEYRKCGCRHFQVDHTREVNRMIIRYRPCRHCGQRMTTCERPVGLPSARLHEVSLRVPEDTCYSGGGA